MAESECQNSAVLFIEKALEEYHKIILISRKLEDGQLRDAFYDKENFKETDKKVLVLSQRAQAAAGKTEWRFVSENEAEEIRKLYYLYEFSDRFAVVEQGQAFGSLLDYVAAGLLTREEMVAAVLR